MSLHKINSLFLTLFFSFCFFNSFSGNTDFVDYRDLDSFNAISVSTGINLHIYMSDTQEVKIKADKNLIEDIITNVRGNTLHIYIKKKKIFNLFKKRKFDCDVYVTIPQLVDISASSGSDVESETILRGDHLKINCSSGSEVALHTIYKNLSIDTSSGSNAKLKGRTKYFTASSSSGSNLDARGLTVQYCEVDVSTGSNISINITDELKASASTGGNIYYYGNPSIKNIDESTGGKVKGR